MQSRTKFPGPWPPTCIGSVLASPQLLDPQVSSSVGALLFDRDGDPQRLVSARWQTSEKSEAELSVSPTHLVQDNLDLDASSDILRLSEFGPFVGNRLYGVKCPDGNTQLFFPCGHAQARIGSALMSSSGNKQHMCLLRDHDSSSGLPYEELAVSPSLRQPILQVSATIDETELGKSISRSLIAARSLYHINVLLAHRQEGHISFNCTAELAFDQQVSHVAWNPHVYGEGAAVLGNGAVCLFDADTNLGKLQLRPTGTLSAPEKIKSLYTAKERPFWQEQANRREKLTKLQKGLNRANAGREHVDAEWWCCDYAWHPRTLFVAGCQQVSLVDFRSNVVNSGMQVPSGVSQQIINSRSSNIAHVTCHGYCTQTVDRDHFLAFSRDDCHGMYHFCVASKRHVLLYDVRRPKIPVLQWEHGMVKEPPRLLLMSLLPTPPSRLNVSGLASTSGKVIFAASVQSGDIRAFCYGSQPVTQSQSSKKSDMDDIVCAWQLPSKVFAPLQAPVDSSGILPHLKDVSLTQEKSPDLENVGPFSHFVSGLFVLGSQGGVRNPTYRQMMSDLAMVQLSKGGDIIAQKYRLSECLTAGSSNPVPKIPAPVSSEGNRLRCKTERMPATLNYIREGTVWPAYASTLCEEEEGDQRLLVGKGKKRKLLESSVFPGKHIKSKQKFDMDHTKVQRCHLDMIRHTMGTSSQVMGINDTHRIHAGDELGRILPQLDSPLGIHEVGRKVVQMQLPPGVAQLASGMPYSEDFIQQRPCFPTPLPVLYGERQICDPDFGDSGLLSGNEEKPIGKQKITVPLPLLLELRQQLKTRSKGYLTVEESTQAEAKKSANGSDMDCNPVVEERSGLRGFESSSKTTHDLLLEAFERVGEDLDHLQHEGEAVSLADTGESYNLTSTPTTLSYKVAPRLPNLDVHAAALSNDCTPSQSDIPGAAACGTQRTSYKFDYSRFVAGRRDGDEGSFSESSSGSFDQSLCPIKLAFKKEDIQLDAYELDKLKAVETSFAKWQQAFSPYKTFTANFGS